MTHSRHCPSAGDVSDKSDYFHGSSLGCAYACCCKDSIAGSDSVDDAVSEGWQFKESLVFSVTEASVFPSGDDDPAARKPLGNILHDLAKVLAPAARIEANLVLRYAYEIGFVVFGYGIEP